EVLTAESCHQKAATKELVADERIDEGGERNPEEDVDDELGALDHRAPDDGQRYRTEHELEEPLGCRGSGARRDRGQVHLRARAEGREETAAAAEGEDAASAEGEAKPDRP